MFLILSSSAPIIHYPANTPFHQNGATGPRGSDLIATVNYHSSFSSHGAPSTHSHRILPSTTSHKPFDLSLRISFIRTPGGEEVLPLGVARRHPPGVASMGPVPVDVQANALAPWGMQPNTSLDESLVLYHLSSDSAYYTIFRNLAVTGV